MSFVEDLKEKAMSGPAAESVLDIADWFFKKAETAGIYLEEDKLHPLVFLAQTHYALKYKMRYLVPGLFICDDNGFHEPNLKKILKFGLPLMGKTTLSEQVCAFLELVWQKYGHKNSFELISIVRSSPAYRKHHAKGRAVLVSLEEMSADFGSTPPPADKQSQRILVSQNGPVMVSKWQPRKLSNTPK